MKKFLFVLVIICLFLPVTALAAPGENVQGYFTYIPTCGEPLWANDNEIYRDCTDVGDWYDGDFIGDSTEVYDLVLHGSQGGFVYDDAWYKGTVTFTLMDKSGTMKIMFIGKSPGNIMVWSGTWVILSGTGSLANIHGQGVFRSSEDQVNHPGVFYEGKIHFAGD